MSTIVGLCKWFTLVVVSPPKYYVPHIDINLSGAMYAFIARSVNMYHQKANSV